MGLDIMVYKNVKTTDSEEEYQFTAIVIDENWDYKIKNLEYGKNYTGEIVNASVSYGYSTHNRIRESLIKIIGRNYLLLKDGKIDWNKLEYEHESEMPFYELINFADNEGCLDFEISTKLHSQFVEWQDEAVKHLSDNDYFKEKYFDWMNVFEKGKEINSVVVFG